jgi:hypothetical protein
MKKAITTLAVLLFISNAAFGAPKSSEECQFAQEIERNSLTRAASSHVSAAVYETGSRTVDNVQTVPGRMTVNAHALTPEAIVNSYGL